MSLINLRRRLSDSPNFIHVDVDIEQINYLFSELFNYLEELEDRVKELEQGARAR